MQTTYHLSSAQELNSEILDAIKSKFKSKSITITVMDEEDAELSLEMKEILDNRLMENEEEYFSDKDSIEKLNKKYGL